MSLFYQVNFAETRQSQINALWTATWVVLAIVILLLGNHAKYLYAESLKPVLQPRLSRLQMYATRVEECAAKWEKTFAAYQEIRPFAEQRKMLSSLQASTAATNIITTMVQHYGDSPLCISPEKFSFKRGEGFTVTLLVPLPKENKKEHIKQVHGTLTNAVAQSIKIGLLPPAATTTVSWGKESPGVTDIKDHVTLRITIPTAATLTFPKVPLDLTKTKNLLEPFRKRIRSCSIKIPSLKTKTTVGEQILSIPIHKGDEYDSLRALQQTYLDPLGFTSEVKAVLPEKMKTRELLKKLDAFDTAWKEISLRCWKREKTLDTEELDALIAEFARTAEALPKSDFFDKNLSKINQYLEAFSKGICAKHIREVTFQEHVIDQTVSQATENRFRAILGNVAVNTGAPRVDFPFWRIILALPENAGSPAKQRNIIVQIPISMLNNVLARIETNSSGTWVTSVAISFVESSEPNGSQEFKVRDILIEGRVPCWMKDTE